jgi:putative N-acetyltransferase (TIGR04045 family)
VQDAPPSRSSSSESPTLTCRPGRGAGELAEHHQIRRAVFVTEQELFAGDDLDDHDADPGTVHVLGFVGEVPAGTVRLYPLGGRLWKGDRLAVLESHRRAAIGAVLVRFAVRTAGELGGERMVAQVQVPNVRFFTVLGWAPVGEPASYHGAPHQQMTIPLR